MTLHTQKSTIDQFLNKALYVAGGFVLGALSLGTYNVFHRRDKQDIQVQEVMEHLQSLINQPFLNNPRNPSYDFICSYVDFSSHDVTAYQQMNDDRLKPLLRTCIMVEISFLEEYLKNETRPWVPILKKNVEDYITMAKRAIRFPEEPVDKR